jgi:hypothetical protein
VPRFYPLSDRADYGGNLIRRLAAALKQKGLKGLSSTNLKLFRSFYLSRREIGQTASDLLPPSFGKGQTLSEELGSMAPLLPPLAIRPTVSVKSGEGQDLSPYLAVRPIVSVDFGRGTSSTREKTETPSRIFGTGPPPCGEIAPQGPNRSAQGKPTRVLRAGAPPWEWNSLIGPSPERAKHVLPRFVSPFSGLSWQHSHYPGRRFALPLGWFVLAPVGAAEVRCADRVWGNGPDPSWRRK